MQFVCTGHRKYKDLKSMGVEVFFDLLQHKFSLHVFCIYVLISSMYLATVCYMHANVSRAKYSKGLGGCTKACSSFNVL